MTVHDTANQMLMAQQDAEKRGSVSFAKYSMTEAKLKQLTQRTKLQTELAEKEIQKVKSEVAAKKKLMEDKRQSNLMKLVQVVTRWD